MPACGLGVTVPISTKPKPSASMASGTSAFLSKPAASPSGLGNARPKAATARLRIGRTAAFPAQSPAARGSSGHARFRHRARAAAAATGERPGLPGSCASLGRKDVQRHLPAAAALPRAPSSPGSCHRHAGRGRRRARAPSAGRRGRPPAKATSTSPSCPAKWRAAVSRTWCAAERWMKPSRWSTAEPAIVPGSLGQRPSRRAGRS